jgi:hypothetical protein
MLQPIARNRIYKATVMPNKELQQAGGNSTPKRRDRESRTAGRSSLRLLTSIPLQGESEGIPRKRERQSQREKPYSIP